MKNWEIVHNMDGENGEPTCWSLEINHEDYGRFVWITLNPENKYDVEIECDTGYGYDVEIGYSGFKTLATCKSLERAKRWVAMNIIWED